MRPTLVVLIALNLSPALFADGGIVEPIRYSPVQRMAREHLAAAQADATRLHATRLSIDRGPLRDYRVILHAHADDSAHTGGTRPEMLAKAKRAGVDAIVLSDHDRPPRDPIAEGWRGMHDGVLFLPGSEVRGFLIAPTRSVVASMTLPTPAFLEAVRADGGLAFLSHIEERPDHAMERLDGMEIYNRHFDAKNDRLGLLALGLRMTDPRSIAALREDVDRYPDALFAAQVEYPRVYLDKWDAETKTRRLAGVAANDCHHNQILTVKRKDEATILVGTNVDRDDQMRAVSASLRPSVRDLTRGHNDGDVLATVDLDPYQRSFRNVGTHILTEGPLDEPTLRACLREGRTYVSHDWMCDPAGFLIRLDRPGGPSVTLGGEAKFAPGSTIVAEFPQTCRARLLRNGVVVAEAEGDRLEYHPDAPGAYRAEGWLRIDGEWRGWIFANPIYLR